jgi:hypothetical protein
MSAAGVVAPWRGAGPLPAPGRPPLALPPERMRMLRGGRPLKTWRWVGFFSEAVMLCAATARIGPVRLAWWAVWDREARTLAEATHHRRGGVVVEPGRVHVAEGPVCIDLALEEGDGVETVSPHGSQYIWTRKQGAVPARGTVVAVERRHAVQGLAVVDDSAGYHDRHTAWLWSAGVGRTVAGAAVAWNLVTGVHDLHGASERTVWVDGTPHELGPVRFDELDGIGFAEGGRLAFTAEAARARREHLGLVRSAYEQPFGTFAGTLPVAGELAQGLGVMERHDVRW